MLGKTEKTCLRTSLISLRSTPPKSSSLCWAWPAKARNQTALGIITPGNGNGKWYTVKYAYNEHLQAGAYLSGLYGFSVKSKFH